MKKNLELSTIKLFPELLSPYEKINFDRIHPRTHFIGCAGCKVMLDRDLAPLYGVETRSILQAVKRNSDRFPEDFMFQLDWEETKILRSQIVTLKPEDPKEATSLRSQIVILD